jgi:hypothetical protein
LHLLALFEPQDRYLRFAGSANDEQIRVVTTLMTILDL